MAVAVGRGKKVPGCVWEPRLLSWERGPGFSHELRVFSHFHLSISLPFLFFDKYLIPQPRLVWISWGPSYLKLPKSWHRRYKPLHPLSCRSYPRPNLGRAEEVILASAQCWVNLVLNV